MRFLLLISLALSAVALRAQETDVTALLDDAELVQERTTVLGPRLGKHLFSPLAGQSLPMVRTFTTANLGGGVSSGVKIPVVVVGGRPVNANVGSLAVLMAHARHEQAIKPWMSFYAEFGITGRLGTNVTSLLAQGINTAIGFDIGWKVRILEDDEWSVVTGLSLKDASFVNIDAIGWAESIIDSGFVGSDVPLLDTKPALRATWTSGAAHSFNEMFGVYAGLAVGVARATGAVLGREIGVTLEEVDFSATGAAC